MDYAHAVLAILVKRLGGRVELPVNEIEAMGSRGEELVSWKDGLAFQYVLELREPPTTREPDVVEQQIKPSELLYLTTDPRETPLVLPPWSRDVPELAVMIDEGHARRRRPDTRCSPTPDVSPIREAREQLLARLGYINDPQPVEPRAEVVNRDQL